MITHPEKVLFPDPPITKGRLAAYYEAIAPLMLPHVRGRPITMERYPGGLGKKGFWQKDISKAAPAWMARVEVPKKGGVVHHPVVTETRALLWLANQNAITLHVSAARVPDLDHPDLCVFDLDPSDEDASAVRGAAIALRDLLEEVGLPSWVKTSGSKGFHLVVPLDRKRDTAEVESFARDVATVLVGRASDQLTQEFSKVERRGRIYIDTGRNGPGATFAAPYTVRARADAPISAPCTWREVERGTVGPATITLRDMPKRIAKHGDVWSDMPRRGRSLTRAIAKLRRGD